MYGPQSNYKMFDERFHNLELPDGVQIRKGEVIDEHVKRLPQFDTGIEELAKIVAGMQKDFKRVNKCITLMGAQAYANKTDKEGKRIRPNWSADAVDITGPDGKPDGIDEVVVFDSKGRAKIVNGWTLRKSDVPKRKAFYTAKVNKPEVMDDMTFTQFKRDAHTIRSRLQNGRPVYAHDLVEDYGVPERYVPYVAPTSKLTAKDYYRQAIFKHIYNQMIAYTKAANNGEIPMEDGVKAIDLAQVFNIAFNDCWRHHVEWQAIANITGLKLEEVANPPDPDTREGKEINRRIRKAKKDSDYEFALTYVLNVVIADHLADATQQIINQIYYVANQKGIHLQEGFESKEEIWGNDGASLPANERYSQVDGEALASFGSRPPQNMQTGGDTDLRIEDLE